MTPPERKALRFHLAALLMGAAAVALLLAADRGDDRRDDDGPELLPPPQGGGGLELIEAPIAAGIEAPIAVDSVARGSANKNNTGTQDLAA